MEEREGSRWNFRHKMMDRMTRNKMQNSTPQTIAIVFLTLESESTRLQN